MICSVPEKGRNWGSSYRSATRTTGSIDDVPLEHIWEALNLRHGPYPTSWMLRPPPAPPYGESIQLIGETCASPPLHVPHIKDITPSRCNHQVALHLPHNPSIFSTVAGAFVDDSLFGLQNNSSYVDSLPEPRNALVIDNPTGFSAPDSGRNSV